MKNMATVKQSHIFGTGYESLEANTAFIGTQHTRTVVQRNFYRLFPILLPQRSDPYNFQRAQKLIRGCNSGSGVWMGLAVMPQGTWLVC